MTQAQSVTLAVNAASALCAFAAAGFWLLSARVNVPALHFTWDGLSQENADAINDALRRSARWNRIAACWAGVSAVFMGVGTLSGI